VDRERLAEEALTPGAFGYFAGGAGDEQVLRENVTAWSEHRLAPKVLVDVSEIDTSVTLLGRQHRLPFLIAPMAYQRHADRLGELATARGAAGAGVGMVVLTQTTTHPREIAAALGEAPRWFQLYAMRDPAVTEALTQGAVDQGYEAIVLTVDFPVGGLRQRDIDSGFAVTEPTYVDMIAGGGRPLPPAERHAQHDPSLTWEHVSIIAEHCGLPLLLKGILRPDDAQRAVDCGAAGIIVSNHGGRQLDAVQPTAHALAPVVDAVGGRVPVLVDGGIRRGSDIAVALVLGADAVLIGRPVLWGLATRSERGVAEVLREFATEFENTLALAGCPQAAALDRSFLVSGAQTVAGRRVEDVDSVRIDREPDDVTGRHAGPAFDAGDDEFG